MRAWRAPERISGLTVGEVFIILGLYVLYEITPKRIRGTALWYGWTAILIAGAIGAIVMFFATGSLPQPPD